MIVETIGFGHEIIQLNNLKTEPCQKAGKHCFCSETFAFTRPSDRSPEPLPRPKPGADYI